MSYSYVESVAVTLEPRNFAVYTCTYFCLPHVEVLGDLPELIGGVFLGRLQHALQILDPLGHSHVHLLPLLCRLRALVKGGMEGLTDLPHTVA